MLLSECLWLELSASSPRPQSSVLFSFSGVFACVDAISGPSATVGWRSIERIARQTKALPSPRDKSASATGTLHVSAPNLELPVVSDSSAADPARVQETVWVPVAAQGLVVGLVGAVLEP
jgi:hypothetical protein